MEWTSDLAYAVGLMATDGSLSKDGRHITFVSQDIEQILNLLKILKPKNKINSKRGGYPGSKNSYYVQFSNVKLYKLLISIGLHPNKSKTLTKINIPDQYFFDFLRGCLDGDGFTYSYWDKRWKSSFMFYSGLTSASPIFLNRIKESINKFFEINGTIKTCGKTAYQLVYAKRSSLILMKKIYYCDRITCLSRKKFKINAALDIIREQTSRDAEMVDGRA